VKGEFQISKCARPGPPVRLTALYFPVKGGPSWYLGSDEVLFAFMQHTVGFN
jgi:hypothetical protein